MQKESDDSIVYVPTMHREFFPEGFSGGVKPLWPGLSSRYWGQRNPDAWHKISLPYTPTEAAACLAELAQLDEAGIRPFRIRRPLPGPRLRKFHRNGMI